MNVYDSQRIAGILQNMGATEAAALDEADLIIFNTCHIREKAAEKLFSDLGRINLIKEERRQNGKETIIGVVGCVVQAEDEEIEKRAPFVNFATGPLTYYRLPEILQKIARDKNICLIDTEFPAESKFDHLPENTAEGCTAYLAVQEGCNNFCTYCIVPYTRGVETSRPVEEVLKEARRLVATGAAEINLLGQNVNSYHGEDAAGKERDFAFLLRKMAEIDGLKRLRYTTSYPADVTDELIACHRELDILMPYLHLPLQSGSDKILKAMNRRHTAGEYLDIIGRLREARPDIGFSSDFIVGFPGETEADFEELKEFVRRVRFDRMGAFAYSEEEGTYAAEHYKDDVPAEVKQQRLDELMDIQEGISAELGMAKVGKTLKVIIDRIEGEYYVGRTEYDSPEVDPEVLIACGEGETPLQIGAFYDVEITSSDDFDLYGTVVSDSSQVSV